MEHKAILISLLSDTTLFLDGTGVYFSCISCFMFLLWTDVLLLAIVNFFVSIFPGIKFYKRNDE
ncbi:MAG: hypothetical protein AAGC64_06420 [Bacteroidota bacterium]